MLKYGADVQAITYTGWTTLHAASQKRHELVVKLLLDNRANVQDADKDGKIALRAASQNGHELVVKLLLDNRADVQATTNTGWPDGWYRQEQGWL